MFEKVRRGGFVFGVGPTIVMGISIYLLLSVWQLIWQDQSSFSIMSMFNRRSQVNFLGQASFVGFATMLLALPFGVAAGAMMTRWAEGEIEYERQQNNEVE